MNAAILAKKFVTTLDCPDARALADFYAKLLGWQVAYSPNEPDWVEVLPPEGENGSFSIACQEIDHYRAPEWPAGETPQQMHLDFFVESLDEATKHAVGAGARLHEVQPGGPESFLVFLDPVGHPFCLCAM